MIRTLPAIVAAIIMTLWFVRDLVDTLDNEIAIAVTIIRTFHNLIG